MIPRLILVLVAPALFASPPIAQETAPAIAQNPKPSLEDLQRSLDKLDAEIKSLQADRDAARESEADLRARYQSLLEELDAQRKSGGASASTADKWYDRLTLGGYGEIHYNSVEGPGGEQLDNSRFVAYMGYRFNDWIELHSETELEHSHVEDGGGGEINLEQLFFDFRADDGFTVRAGRFLTPLGILNKTHEPTTFNGVERPAFETFIIPTTWSADGAGVLGDISDELKYELYLQSSLDGTGFDPVQGIREGRQEERPGLSQPGLSGRLDWYAITKSEQSLRLGLSFFGGGLDNGNQGVNPDIDADLEVYCTDAQLSSGGWDFRGAYAFEKINGAADIGGNVASEIEGWYAEAAYHFWPEHWKDGRLAKSDAVAFVRYDDVDTQSEVPSGATRDPRGTRNEWTVGLSFFPTTGVVLKADYQIRDDDSGTDLPEQLNLGLGFSF